MISNPIMLQAVCLRGQPSKDLPRGPATVEIRHWEFRNAAIPRFLNAVPGPDDRPQFRLSQRRGGTNQPLRIAGSKTLTDSIEELKKRRIPGSFAILITHWKLPNRGLAIELELSAMPLRPAPTSAGHRR